MDGTERRLQSAITRLEVTTQRLERQFAELDSQAFSTTVANKVVSTLSDRNRHDLRIAGLVVVGLLLCTALEAGVIAYLLARAR